MASERNELSEQNLVYIEAVVGDISYVENQAEFSEIITALVRNVPPPPQFTSFVRASGLLNLLQIG